MTVVEAVVLDRSDDAAASLSTTHAEHNSLPHGHQHHRVAHMVHHDGASHPPSLMEKLSIRSSDSASHADSTSSAPAIIEKVRKVKSKMKDKLHIGKHGENGHEDDDDDESFQDEDDEVPLAAVRDRSRTSTSSSEVDRTNAQRYAEQFRLPDETEGSNSPRSSGLATPLGADNSDDDDENIIILHSGNNKSAPNLLQKSSVPGTPASIKGVKSPPGTNNTVSTAASLSHERSRGSISLPASQSDWKRRAEFHNLFEGKVDEEEHLVSDYACAWVKDIFRQGRLYVGACNLAFICTIIGLKTSVVIPYDDIAKIEKSVTARVIPNAMTITTTQGDSYLFASFMYRDASYDLIMDCWSSKSPSAHAAFIATLETVAEGNGEVAKEKNTIDEEGDKTINEAPFSGETAAPATEHTAHAATECSGNHFSETVLDVRFPSEPEKIFKLLFHTPEFQAKVNSDMGLTAYETTPWAPNGAEGLSKRESSYIKPLSGSIGPSSAKCIIVDEELAKDTEKAFEVLSITKTPDVPSGGSFSVHTKTCLTWAGGSKGGCRMLVTTEVVWTGRSMVKGIITSSSIAGQRSYNKDIARMIRQHIQSNPAEFGSQDTTAPEADDELSAPPDTEADSSKGGISTSSAHGRPTGMFRSIIATIQQSEGMATVLLVSNIALLFFFVISLFTSGLPGSKKVEITKTVLSEEAEKLALQRLLRMEDSWKGLQQCVQKMVNDAA